MEFDDLYQEIILDHYRRPRHAAKVPDDELLIEEENPTCGDQIRLTATLKDGILQDLRHECRGCAISTASASMMAEELVGKPIDEVRRRIHDFVALMRSEKSALDGDAGDLIALEGVRNYPLRIKCATMAWHAAEQAIDKLAGKA